MNFSRNGVIGKSGKWYPCGISGHDQVQIDHCEDCPFAVVRTHFGDTHIGFDAYYTVDKAKPTNAQFNTLMDWCTAMGKVFEEVTDCWALPWSDWRDD